MKKNWSCPQCDSDLTAPGSIAVLGSYGFNANIDPETGELDVDENTKIQHRSELYCSNCDEDITKNV